LSNSILQIRTLDLAMLRVLSFFPQ